METAGLIDSLFNTKQSATPPGGNRGQGGAGRQAGRRTGWRRSGRWRTRWWRSGWRRPFGGGRAFFEAIDGRAESPAGRQGAGPRSSPTGDQLALVKANPLDMLTIRNLLTKSIDVQFTDSDGHRRRASSARSSTRTRTDVATIIRDVYAENMNRSATSGRRSAAFPGIRCSPVAADQHRQREQARQPVGRRGRPH